MKSDISNRLSALGSIIGLAAGFFMLIWFAIMLIAVIWIILYKMTEIQKDDALRFLIFGLIGVIVMYIVGIILSVMLL